MGFEPTVGFHPHLISNQAPSTGLGHLSGFNFSKKLPATDAAGSETVCREGALPVKSLRHRFCLAIRKDIPP